MAKKAYIGIDNTARKIKKGYIGIEGVARKIKKAYIGVGGVARPCWPGGEPKWYGAIEDLPYNAAYMGAVDSRQYAVFAGGDASWKYGPSRIKRVTAFNESMQRIDVVSNLDDAVTSPAGACIQDHFLFGAGTKDRGTSAQVNVYNNLLTKQTSLSLQIKNSNYYMNIAGKGFGHYAFFWGYDYINIFSDAFVRTTMDGDSVTNNPRGAIAGEYVMFAGSSNKGSAKAYALSQSLVRTQVSDMSTQRGSCGAASAGSFALFAGGYYVYNTDDSRDTSSISVYDANLVAITPLSLEHSLSGIEGCTFNGYAIFPGNKDVDKKIEAFDHTLTKSIIADKFSRQRSNYAAATTNSCAYFVGGGENGSNSSLGCVDVIVM